MILPTGFLGGYFEVPYFWFSGEFISIAIRSEEWVGLHFFDQNIGIPFGISMLTGLSNHHAEFSLTLIPFIKNFNYLFKEGNLSDKQLYIVPGIGYRFQKPDGGILVKGLISPMIFLDPPSDNFWNMDPKINPAINLGIGWTFKKKQP